MKFQMNTADKTIAIGALTVLLGSAYLLIFGDRYFTGRNINPESIVAQITSKELDVRLKGSQEFVWTTAQEQSAISIGDSLFTGSDSTATIQFNDGSTLTVEPNSLISFNSVNQEMSLNLKFGDLITRNIAENSNLSLKIQDKNIKLNSPNTKSKVKITSKGSMKPADPDLPKPERTQTIKPAIVVSQVNSKISWTTQIPSVWTHNHKNKALNLSWKSSGVPMTSYRVQLSKDNSFTAIDLEAPTTATTLSTQSYPETGEYFIRVVGDSDTAKSVATSAVHKILFDATLSPYVSEPKQDQILSFKTDFNGKLATSPQVATAWEYAKEGSNFRVELSTSQNFDKLASSQIIKKAKVWVTPKLISGQYFLRVREELPGSKADEAVWSEPRSFTVTIEAPPKLQSPILITKKIDHVLPNSNNPALRWQPLEGSGKYVVEYAASKNFKNSKSLETKETSLALSDFKIGLNYFRVFAKTSTGAFSLPSETGQLNVNPKAPSLNPTQPIHITGKSPEDVAPAQKIPASWERFEFADSYKVEYSENQDFRNSQEIITKDAQTEIPISKPGKYHWRVQALDETQKELSPKSSSGELNYSFKVPYLKSPTLSEPASDITLFFQNSKTNQFWTQWNSVPLAKEYLIEFSAASDFSKVILSKKVASPRALISEALPQGSVYWRVKAIAEDTKDSFWSETRTIKIYSGRTPAGRQ